MKFTAYKRVRVTAIRFFKVPAGVYTQPPIGKIYNATSGALLASVPLVSGGCKGNAWVSMDRQLIPL